jgi:gamma-glutamylcyclotransferase (GGCT)/AIG2-like uncharacterized protein YtfP
VLNIDPEAAKEPREGMLNLAAKSGAALPALLNALKALHAEPELAPLREPAADTAAVAVEEKKAAAEPKRKASVRAAAKAVSAARSIRSNPVQMPGSLKSKAKPATPPQAATPPQEAEPVEQLFVYGSLRPDDTSGQEWTKDFVAGAEAKPALLRGASLYRESYAAVVLEETQCTVRGMVLRFPGAWKAKLKEADRIEGFPELYTRCVEWVEVLDRATGAASGEKQRAWVYHRTGKVDRAAAQRIPDGDWLSRPKS